MIGLAAPALLIVVAVIVQIALPGRAVYHTGWYNVGLAALVIYALFVSRARLRRGNHPIAIVPAVSYTHLTLPTTPYV